MCAQVTSFGKLIIKCDGKENYLPIIFVKMVWGHSHTLQMEEVHFL